jgi:hypothetical protein
VKQLTDRLRAEWDTAAIGLAIFLFHLWHAPAVARGGLFLRDNLAFDFDINRFVALWGASPFPVIENENYYAVRHPLAVLVRLVCRPLVMAGIDAHVAACAVAAFCAALSDMIVYRIALALGLRRGLAALMTLLWALSTASLLLGVLPETYDLAFVALGLQFLLTIRWALGREPSRAARIALAVANFGITITNVVLSGLAELTMRLCKQKPRAAFLGTAGFSAAVVAIGIALGAISFHIWPVDRTTGTASPVKQLYWDASSAERTSARQSVAQVTWTFAAISFVSPPPAQFATGVPGNSYLWDLRGNAYGAPGWIAVLGWLVLLLLGAAAAARDRQLRPVWIVAGLWIAANIALHSYWQFRDTVFLYSAHSHIAFFLLALAGAKAAQDSHPRGGLAYSAAAALVTLFLAINNLPVYLSLPRLG